MYSYEQMLTELELLKNTYPNLMILQEAGTSLDGRKIMEVIVGNPDTSRHILIQSTIHGREYMNTRLAMTQLGEILRKYTYATYHGIPYECLFEQVCFHILPMTNPDGVTISQLGLKGIRNSSLKSILENCRQNDLGRVDDEISADMYWKRWKANARGVDLNRNFNSGWKAYQGSVRPSFERYKGECPESEPEVQTILKVAENNPTICTISYHSSGEVIYWDYGSTEEILEADRQLAKLVSHIIGYSMESSVQSAQDAAGCSDYFVLEKNIPSVTIENGKADCPLPMEEFGPIWKANDNLWPALAEFMMRDV